MEINKLQPADILKTLDRLRREDMKKYTDPATGKLKESMSVEVSFCPACVKEARTFLFQKEAFDYYQCMYCGHVYVSPRLNDENLLYLYREGRSDYQTKHFYLPTAEYRKENIYRRKVEEILKTDSGKTLLDYGCSTGYFLQTAIEMGFDGHGVELNSFGVKWAREKLGLKNIYDKDIKDCGFDKYSFDVITIWDVLEHVPNPFDLLSELRPYLNPDGFIVIETSYYDCFETEFLGMENTNLVGDIHLMHFTSPSLDELTTRAGYKIVKKDIFGLDLSHIINFHLLNRLPEIKLPPELTNSIQNLIDQSDKGCYIKIVLRKSTPPLIKFNKSSNR